MFQSSAPRSFCRLLARIVALAAIVFVAVVLLGQKQPPKADNSASNSPKYDSKTEETIKGTVDELKAPGADEKPGIARLVLKHGSQSTEVLLCPQTFLDEMGISFSKGEALEVVGSKVKEGDQEEVLAREIAKGNDTIVLRDKSGKPVW